MADSRRPDTETVAATPAVPEPTREDAMPLDLELEPTDPKASAAPLSVPEPTQESAPEPTQEGAPEFTQESAPPPEAAKKAIAGRTALLDPTEADMPAFEPAGTDMGDSAAADGLPWNKPGATQPGE
ncbi:MAG: hypothetical protein KC492_32750, partial [Myxococcales bacterium]|nr:hypothetical protein [Myxococcales bacterium]